VPGILKVNKLLRKSQFCHYWLLYHIDSPNTQNISRFVKWR